MSYIKKSVKHTSTILGREVDYYGNTVSSPVSYDYAENIELHSEGHNRFNKKHFDVGGEFLLFGNRQYWSHYGLSSDVWAPSNWFPPSKQRYFGKFAANTSSIQTPPTGDGASWGPEAYKRMKPTKPSFEALNSIYELRDLPHMLRSLMHAKGFYKVNSLSHARKKLGDGYLAWQFGWVSLFNDIIKLVNSQLDMQKRLAWLLQHNGKPVRRRVTIYDTQSTTTYSTATGYQYLNPVLPTQFYVTTPTARWVEERRDRVWASARFRYWLPSDPKGVVYSRRVKAALFGLHLPPPSVIWNALPWTWMADWFFSVGDILENMDAGVADRLATDYFYVMREQNVHSQYQVSARMRKFDGFHTKDTTVTPVYGTDAFRKTRLAGDPFGFGTNPSDLSSMQLAILGALGLSRL